LISLDKMDETMQLYVKEFIETQLLAAVPEEEKAGIENMTFSREAIEAILLSCLSFVSDKVEAEMSAMVERGDQPLH